jgi:hypothetical protein
MEDEMKERLEWIEQAAWRHLRHEMNRALRDNPENPLMCSEAWHVLEYFEEHGVKMLTVDDDDELQLKRVPLKDTGLWTNIKELLGHDLERIAELAAGTVAQ